MANEETPKTQDELVKQWDASVSKTMTLLSEAGMMVSLCGVVKAPTDPIVVVMLAVVLARLRKETIQASTMLGGSIKPAENEPDFMDAFDDSDEKVKQIVKTMME